MITFEQNLRTKSLKITPQRMTILNQFQHNGHMSVDELFAQTKQLHPSISLATIYKNIHLLCEANILREVKVPTQKPKYELNSDQHIHTCCEICGKIKDIKIDTSKLQEDGALMSGYTISDISAVLIGQCPECQAKSQDSINSKA